MTLQNKMEILISRNKTFTGVVGCWVGNTMISFACEARLKWSLVVAYELLKLWLDDWGSMVRFLAGAGNFSLYHRVQNGSGTHPVSYPTGTRGSFPGGKVAGA
jgi:hypothetical protein